MTMSMKLRAVAVFTAVALVLFCSSASMGQVLKGSISGTVVDPHDAVVSGAEVKATNTDTGVSFTTITDSSGLFRLNLLPVGTYKIEVSASGFKKLERGGIAVSAGVDTAVGSAKLTVGESTTTVEVVAETPLIESTQAQVTNTFSGVTLQTFAGIEENQGLDRLALFVPGVVSSRSNNFSNTNGVGFSSNGLRGRNNDQEIDGQNNNDNSVGGPGLFLSNTEFVGQYVLVTNNFGPEYGRNSGSVVNIITKSGTNTWHGSVFGQDRSSFLDALNNTQKNTNKPGTNTGNPGTVTCPVSNPICNPFSGPPRFNEEFSGGAIGGPLMKNKAFIFGGFDTDLFSGTSVYTTTALTPTLAGLATLAACPSVNATALSVLNKFGPYAFGFGNPSPRNTAIQTLGGCAGVEVGGVTRVVTSPFHGFDWVVKTDLNFGNNSITGRYLFNRGNSFGGGSSGTGAAAAGWVNNVPALSQAALISWTHNFGARMVNEARISYSRLGVVFGGGLNPLLPVAGQLDQAFTNISFQLGNGLGIGPATNIPQSRLVGTWQLQDNWNYVAGKHSFKAGVNFSYQRSPNIFLPNINGQFRFTNLSTFLGTDTPNRIQIAQGQSGLDFREYDTFLFVGDDWKIGRNLTLNLGLTWTYYGSPSNLFNDITTKRESDASKALWLQSLPLSVRTFPQIPSVRNSFGPSVGFAYSPQWGGFLTGHGKTTFRGGYRLLYDPPFYNIFVNISSSAPETFLQTLTGAQATANPLLANPTGPNVRAQLAAFIASNTFDPRTQNETTISPDFGPDKVHSWSLGFEREITKNAVFEARYVGNHGYNLFQTVDGNPVTSGQIAAGLLPASTPSCAATTQSGPGAGTDLNRLSCGFGVVRTRNNAAFSDYHALQTEFRANNLFKQLNLRAGYTWSKALDNVSEIFSTGSAGNTIFAAQNPFQTGGAERSTSGLSIPNVFTFIAIEQLPFFKEQHGAIGHILGGWTISADYIRASGQPYTPLQGNGEALFGSPFGNVYDTNWVLAFVGTDVARPFYGSRSAPINSVGAFAHDACGGTAFGCSAAIAAALAALPANQLVSINALNHTDPTTGLFSPSIVQVTNSDVRYIINGASAQTIFGTPFGNVPRNPDRDAPANVLNATVYKSFKFGERASFEMHLTATNVLNHFNFSSVIPNVEFAGVGTFGSDFANPKVTSTLLSQNGSRVIWIGGKFTF